MVELTVHQKQQYALLVRQQVEPDKALEMALDLVPAEAKSSMPDYGSGSAVSLPSQFGLANYPPGLYLHPPEVMQMSGRERRKMEALGNQSPFDLANNSAITATINTVALACTEAPIVVKRVEIEEEQLRLEVVRKHAALTLLDRPNLCRPEDPDSKTFMNVTDMVWLREYCLHVDGNAYWMIVRLGDPLLGLPVMLIPVMPYMMEPVTITRQDGTSTDQISYYAYAPSEQYLSKPMRVSVQNVLHFRYGRDPKDLRKGLGLVKRLYREEMRDGLASFFTNALLRNGAIPGLVVQPSEGTIEEDEAREAKAALRAAFAGSEAGSIAVLERGAKIEQFGFNPDQLNLAGFHKHAEERIAAVLNVPAMVAQLGAGLEQASQFSNFHEAREMFAENTVIPRLKAANAVLQDLMREFTDDPALFLMHDAEQIRALSQDVSERFQRYQTAVRGGWMTANEARALAANLPPIDSKSQQVPRTQGEDNRLNDMMAQGLLTVNEARQTVDLPPIEGGDVTTIEFANKLKPPETSTAPGDPTKPPPATSPTVGATNPTERLETGGPTTGRQGADIGSTKSRATDLEKLFAQTDPDLLLREWLKLRADGLSLVDVAFPVAG